MIPAPPPLFYPGLRVANGRRGLAGGLAGGLAALLGGLALKRDVYFLMFLGGLAGGLAGDSRGTRSPFWGTRSETGCIFLTFWGDSPETTPAFYNIKKGSGGNGMGGERESPSFIRIGTLLKI